MLVSIWGVLRVSDDDFHTFDTIRPTDRRSIGQLAAGERKKKKEKSELEPIELAVVPIDSEFYWQFSEQRKIEKGVMLWHDLVIAN